MIDERADMSWDKPYRPPKNQRLDPELYKDTNRVTFITIRAYQNQSPFIRADLNQLVVDILRLEQERRQCAVFTYCLMPDHLHYLASPQSPGISVLTFTDQFKGKTTNSSWTMGWRGKLWQPRYYDHIVRAEEDLRAIAEYILNNPVRKGLVEQPEDWPWSGQLTLFSW
jgi:putative transposase